MNLRKPGLWIGVASLGLVLVVAVVSLERTAPGPLSRAHASVPELAGMNDCSACHGGWFSSMAEACLECHDTVAEHIETGRGLHGMALDGEVARCASCHSEHHGADFEALNDSSFALAGVPDPELFDHGLVGFEMDGAHLEQDCTECHENAEALDVPEGMHRFLGLEQNCASCHDDAHEGAMQIDCARCHGQANFLELEGRGHGAQLPLAGGHGDLDCTSCHAAGSPHALEALGAAGVDNPVRACTVCHETPHAMGFLAGVSWMTDMTRDRACAQCHLPAHDSFAESAIVLDAQQHAQSGFQLGSPHQTVACDDCHGGETFSERFPGRTQKACAQCHEDPHAGQFLAPESAAKDCLSCHDEERFLPHEFALADHAVLALPLDGAHSEQDCAACHLTPEDGGAQIFRATPERCDDCHGDAHAGALVDRDGALSLEPAGSCAVCHGTQSFGDESVAASFDHVAFTQFPVVDAHAQADCESCHPRSAEPDDFGRRFGRIPEHFDPEASCSSCHEDPHAGRFDLPGLPERIDGFVDCARCHLQSSFRVPRLDFDHSLWTGYALDGAHAELDCASCHGADEVSFGAPGSLAPALGNACSDCHSDPHAGQFRIDGVNDCQRCHTPQPGFSANRFDHDLDASFELGSAHAELACSECHEAYPWGNQEIVRYRPIEARCVDCHGATQDELLELLGERR